MTDKGKNKIRGRIQTFVRNSRIKNGEIDFLHAIGLSRDLSNFTSNYVANSDHVESNHLYSHITWQFINFIKNKSIRTSIKGKESGELKDYVSIDVMESFEKILFEELTTIPHTYSIRFQLEEATELPEMSITISEGIILEVTDSSDVKPLAISKDLFTEEPNRSSYLVLEIQGFCSHDLSSSAIQKTITIIKVIIFFIWDSNTIVNLEFSSMNNKLSTFRESIITNRFLQIQNLDSNFQLLVTLPNDFTHFLNNFKFKSDDISSINFSNVSKLLQSNTDGSKRIKSAIEWYIDSTFNKSDSVKFIQTCIGLESLLGDDRQEGPLSYTLADRCAYLIADSIDDREIIRKEFKQIYKIRSKLVHGTSRNIRESELKHYTHARQYLKQAIMKELSHLKVSND